MVNDEGATIVDAVTVLMQAIDRRVTISVGQDKRQLSMGLVQEDLITSAVLCAIAFTGQSNPGEQETQVMDVDTFVDIIRNVWEGMEKDKTCQAFIKEMRKEFFGS